jgi:hypothetical protein
VASILADHDPEASSVRVDRGLILLALAAGDDTISEALILRLALPRSLRETLGGWKTAAHSQGALSRAEVAASEIHAALRSLDPAQLAWLAALSGDSGTARVLLEVSTFRGFELCVSAADLLGAGAHPGPAIGRALRSTLAARLDGRIGAEQEFDYALRMVDELDSRAAKGEPGT